MILRNLIYIYQLENYDRKRFLSFAYGKVNWLFLSKRNKLDWTIRATLIFVLVVLLIVFFSTLCFYRWGVWQFLFCLFGLVVLLPVIIVFVDILISPIVLLKKESLMKMAKKIIQDAKSNEGLITIGITGSFGKTTMKNVMAKILNEKYEIFLFPGNVNTEIGVARYLIKHQKEVLKADILVSEMGAYRRGDIKKICNIIEPDYSIITSIGESHLERFGSLDNVASTKFELVEATRKKVFLNFCDKNLRKYVELMLSDNDIEMKKLCGHNRIKDMVHLKDFQGIKFKYAEQIFNTSIIADYIIDFLVIAIELSKELGLNLEQIKSGIKKIKPVSHRLEIIRNKETNRVIIDDTYNGNYAGFLAGLKILEQAKGRKVVLTPGIVELGEKAKEIHLRLARKYLESRVDLVMLIRNKNTEIIEKYFKKNNFRKYLMYDTTEDAHKDLSKVLKNGDTIIFQNDLSDNY